MRSQSVEQLGDLGRGDEDRRCPRSARLEQQPVDLGLRADVDAARRLVEHQHARARRRATSRARPSAGCRPRGSRRARAASGRGSAARVDPPRPTAARGRAARRREPGDARGRRHHEVLAHAHLQHEPLRACGRRGRRRRPSRIACCGRAVGDRARRRPRSCPCARAQAEERLEQLAPARADEAGEADDLARRDVEVDASSTPGERQRADAQHRAGVRRRVRPTARVLVERRGRPSARSAAVGRTRRPAPPPTVSPVAEHRDAVGELEDLASAGARRRSWRRRPSRRRADDARRATRPRRR